MKRINICGVDYRVPRGVAQYIAEMADTLAREQIDLGMIQAGAVFEDRSDPMAVFSREYAQLKQAAVAWGTLCEKVGLPLASSPDEIVKKSLLGAVWPNPSSSRLAIVTRSWTTGITDGGEQVIGWLIRSKPCSNAKARRQNGMRSSRRSRTQPNARRYGPRLPQNMSAVIPSCAWG